MKSTIITLTAAIALVHSCTGITSQNIDPEHTLWYDEPASIWEETLPLGNGRLGMMPDGGIIDETVVLNEISLWSGSEADYSNPQAAESLPQIRELLQQGRNAEAQELMYSSFVPKKPSDGGTYGGYQTLGDLKISYPLSDDVTEYRRGLDLKTATAWTEFTLNGVQYYRKYHVSRNKDIMIIEIGASEKGKINFDIELSRKERAAISVTEEGLIEMTGVLDSGTEAEGMKYSAYAGLLAEGKEAEKSSTGVRNADRAWIVISATTDWFEGEGYKAKANDLLTSVTRQGSGRKMDAIHKESIRLHQKLYNRAGISLDSDAAESHLTTDKRISAYHEGSQDNDLASLYFHYGRYLMICSTRPGSLPPNLQGLWANTYQTPWNGDYHTNINVQMNHWIVEKGNLSELHLPLTELVMKLIPSGQRTAKAFYGPDAEGWVQHMMTNIWNFTEPGEHPSWGATNTGGAWLCAHLWEHYAYTRDIDYLERIYPALEGASRFFLSTMMTDRNTGYLVTGPTSSPENTFVMDGKDVSICMGPTMDNQLVRELFLNTLKASWILNDAGRDICDQSVMTEIDNAIRKIAPNRISENGGYLMEWLEDYQETDIHHRHVSHLYGLHPGHEISVYDTPELAEACRVTLNRRGDESTGWSRAWKLNFWARLADGDRALKLLRSLLGSTYPNLFCSHPPFQIDGNFGGAAGICEMVVQSHYGLIIPLPALPAQWKSGSAKGIKVEGGDVVDLTWENGKIKTLTITGKDRDTVLVRDPETGKTIEVSVKPGKKRTLKF